MRIWIDYEKNCINFYFDFAKEKRLQKTKCIKSIHFFNL